MSIPLLYRNMVRGNWLEKVVSCFASPSAKLLHDRLGHPHLSKS